MKNDTIELGQPKDLNEDAIKSAMEKVRIARQTSITTQNEGPRSSKTISPSDTVTAKIDFTDEIVTNCKKTKFFISDKGDVIRVHYPGKE